MNFLKPRISFSCSVYSFVREIIIGEQATAAVHEIRMQTLGTVEIMPAGIAMR